MSQCSGEGVLLQNVFSVFIITVDKKRVYRQYGKAEEKVKIISDHGSVLIVENKAGNRFPVENTDIKILNDDKAKKKVQVDIDAD